MTVDALDNPTAFYLMGWQAYDLGGADVLLPDFAVSALVGDKGYDAEVRVLVALVKDRRDAVIFLRGNRIVLHPCDKILNQAIWLSDPLPSWSS